jgi:hypothetical protein
MPSRIARDDNAAIVQLMPRSGTPQTLTVNASGGAATLSAAIESRFVRLHPTVDTWILFTVAGAVTSANGHFCAGGGCYDEPLPAGTTKISVLGVTGAGTCYLSELGNI